MYFYHNLSFFLFTILLFCGIPSPSAMTYPMPVPGDDLVGSVWQTKAHQEDTLLDIARRHGLGQDEIVLANTAVDRWLPGEDATVVLPAQFIFPRVERKGIVLNLPEMRLYYFYRDDRTGADMVRTYPVSVGRMDWNTPLGKSRIEKKEEDPFWRPPESLKLEALADGRLLPDVVPPGPDNPLGRYAMRLSIPGYLIHSTNKPYGVGMRVTHGCVRMYPEDIEELFPIVPLHTTVQIVNQPLKLGWQGKTLFMEVHPLLEEERGDEKRQLCMAYEMILAEIENRDAILDIKTIKQALKEKSGIPVPITTFVSDGFDFK